MGKYYLWYLLITCGLPWWLSGKIPACHCRKPESPGLMPGSVKPPGGGNGNPLQCSCLGNLMDRGSLVGYSRWGHKRVGHDLVTKQHLTYMI